MILKFDDKKLEVREEYVESIISKSTGKELNTYRFKVKVVGEKKFDDFKEKMKKFKEEFVYQVDKDDNLIAKFNVGTWKYRYYNEFDANDVSYLCDIEIIQKEDLKTNTICIAGVEVEVLKYREEFDKYNDAIIITAVIMYTDEQWEIIKKSIGENEYFKVIRKDISSDILEMRFGKTIWSKHDNFIKRRITLVEKKYDEKDKKNKPFLWPEFQNVMSMLSKNISYTQKLEEILKDRNILTEDNIRNLKDEVERDYKNIYKEIYLVKDAEEDFN